MTDAKGPVLIELDSEGDVNPQDAPVVPELATEAEGRAMQTIVAIGARKPSVLSRWFWRLGFAVISFGVSIWAWDTVNRLLERNTYLGGIAVVLVGAFVLVCFGIFTAFLIFINSLF